MFAEKKKQLYKKKLRLNRKLFNFFFLFYDAYSKDDYDDILF